MGFSRAAWGRGSVSQRVTGVHQVAPPTAVDAVYVAPDWDPWDRIWGWIVWLWGSRGEHHLQGSVTFAICSCDGSVIPALGLEFFST